MSNARKLRTDEQDVLQEVLSKYLPEDAEQLLRESPENWLSALRTRVRDSVGEELAAGGLNANYEPTSRGRLLEGLIDYLNRLEFGPKPS